MTEFKPGDRILFETPFGMVFQALVEDVSADGEHLAIKVGNRTEIKPAKECRLKHRYVARSKVVRQRLGDARRANKSINGF